MKNYIGKNIQALRLDKGLSQGQLGEIAGVVQTTVSSWECGSSEPRSSNIKRIVDYFPELELDDIYSEEMGYAHSVLVQAKSLSRIPLYGSIAAGNANEMIPVKETHVIPPRVHKKYPRGFLLKVKGESMNRALPDGCYALVNPTKEVIDGKIYAVCIGTSEATIKRVHLLNNGIELQPYSSDPTFKARVFDYDDEDEETVTIIGRVVWYTMPDDYEL